MLRKLMMAGASAPPATYLDELSVQPRAVFSIHKKISTATVPCRVSRSSDDAEMDAGFDGDTIDIADVLSWSGSDSVYIKSWKDQTGNSEDADQGTVASRPRIVNAGTYLGYVEWDGSNDFLKITSLTLGTAYVGLYAKWEQPTNSSVKALVETSSDYLNNADTFICYEYSPQGGLVGASHDTGGSIRGNAFDNATSGIAVWSVLYDRTLTGVDEVKAWRAGVSKTPTSVGSDEQTGTFASNDCYIGARVGPTLVSTLKAQTLAIYTADTAAIRASIEAAIA
jgi:hypothetical protein